MFHEPTWPMIAAVVVGALAIAYVRWRADFVVRVRSGRCYIRGKLALVRQKALAQFLLDDLRPRGPVTIRGRLQNGRMRLFFHGPLTPAERQRIRNFMMLSD